MEEKIMKKKLVMLFLIFAFTSLCSCGNGGGGAFHFTRNISQQISAR